MVLAIYCFHLFYIDFSFRDFGRWKQHLFDILFFAHFKKCILKNLVEFVKTTFDLKFACSIRDEWNLVYNKK